MDYFSSNPSNAKAASDRIIAVGDIHGCSTALKTLLDAINPTSSDTIVTLGDYVDRGPDSRGVLEQLIELQQRCALVPLLGNHEEMFLAAREGRSDLAFWLKFGGQEMLESYGARDPKDIPVHHVWFMRNCSDYYETAEHIFVHAYYDPHRPLNVQGSNGLRWAALPSVPQRHCSGKTAIVGHTSQMSGEILNLGYFKCIDTFCHGGGWLTALEVTTGQFWQADQKGLLRTGRS